MAVQLIAAQWWHRSANAVEVDGAALCIKCCQSSVVSWSYFQDQNVNNEDIMIKASKLALVLMSSCSLLLASCSGYNSTSIPNVPYLNLDVHKQSHLMTSTDRVCVFNGGDMITDTGTRYKNSGRFMQKILVTTMQQYNVDGAIDLSSYPAEDVPVVSLQEKARENYCNVIAVSRPIFWQDSQISPGNVGLKVDMYDTSSLELINSVTLNARSKYIRDMFLKTTPLRPVIETYVDTLYR